MKGLVRHFSSLVGDVLDSVFEWDGRLPRTIAPLLLKPGYLTREYLAGHRVRYVSPFRLFFFLAVLTFFIGQLTVSFGENGGVNFGGDNAIETALTVEDVEKARDKALAELADAANGIAAGTDAANGTGNAPGKAGADIGRRASEAAIRSGEAAVRAQAEDRIRRLRAAEQAGQPPPPPNVAKLSFGDGEWDAEKNPIRIAWLPGFANDWLNQQALRVQKNIPRLQEDPDLFKDAMLGAVPSTLFVLLPVFALMLKVLYLFKRRLYMEHLIVALHSHAFLCLAVLLLFVLMALGHWLAPQGGALGVVFHVLEAALWIWMPLYLLLMQKRVYGQGWPMTLLKYTLLGWCYVVLLSFGAAFTAIAGLVGM
ncbi:MAG: DUF3667 domain-containing protein [Luteimonas sp.]|nr:DUF3667 domain-containing protein [Luteimonas sp.]